MLFTPEGQTHNGVAEVRDGNVKEASRQATLKALQDREAKQLGWLVVQSTPTGASVELDGTPSGKTPYKRMVPVGKHTLKLTAPGHSSQTRDVTVSTKGTAITTLQLEPGDSDEDASGSKPSEWNYVIGGGLAVVGGLAIASFVRTAIEDGDCVGDVDAAGVCDKEVQLSPWGWVSLGVGAAFLAGAGAMFIWQPLRVDITTDGKTTAAIQLRGEF